jgi:uncharacterized membrane protein YtjA (UPF0391 family)
VFPVFLKPCDVGKPRIFNSPAGSGHHAHQNTQERVLSRQPFNRKSAGNNSGQAPKSTEEHMLRWAVGFFLIALVAALFGFGGIAVATAGIAKILFFIFLVLFLVALLGGAIRRA